MITCGAAPEAWAKGPVLVDCGAVDAGSGVAGDASKGVRLTAEVPADQEAVVATDSTNVCDNAGNCATAGPVSGVKVDNRAPTVSCGAPTGGAGSEAVVACSATDGGSGLVNPPGPAFELSTDVGAGNANPAAATGEQEVCDTAANCRDAGPFTTAVDRTTVPPGEGPVVSSPRKVTVLGAIDPAGPVPAPYLLPAVPSGSSIACQPSPGTVLNEGWTVVSCDARDQQGRSTTASFLLVVKNLPSLAPDGPARRGAPWRAIGVGFGPGSNVSLEFDGRPIGQQAAGTDGRISVDFTIPDSANPGRHTVVLRGTDSNGDPFLVVSYLDVIVDGEGSVPPALPPSGPSVPPDPTPVPALPTFERLAVPSTTTTTIPGQTTTTLNEATTTTDGGSPTSANANTGNGNGHGSDGVNGVNDANGANGSSGAASADGSQSDGSNGSTSGVLPVTGIALGLALLVGLSLIVSGGGLSAVARRRGNDADVATGTDLDPDGDEPTAGGDCES